MATDIDVLSDKKILQYPLGLGSSALDAHGEEQHYVIFKINTDEKTTRLRDDNFTGNVVSASRVGTGVATKLIDAKNTDPDITKLYGDAAVKKERWTVQKGLRRLDKVIVLPMPNEHTVGTKVGFSEVDQTLLTRLGDIGNQDAGNTIWEYLRLKKNSVLASAAFGSTNATALNAEDHIVVNPKKEVLFQGFGFRNFSFSYLFAPKSEEESEMVKSIIEAFRYYALPEISSAKAFYIFPSEFEISFMQGQKINPHIPKIATTVLESISVNYMPKNVWAVLPNGAPLALSISMQFKELELVDRLRVANKESTITSGY